MKRIFSLLALALIVISCGPTIDTQALRDEVLDIHDEVMPRMGEVMSLRKKVLTKSESVTDSTELENLKEIAYNLIKANQGMMTWMNDWTKSVGNFLDQDAKPIAGVDVNKVVEYLEEEKKRVSKVRDDINNSIKEAKEVLE